MHSHSQFEALALPHLALLYRRACQIAGPDRADDLVQETFLKAWAHFHSFDPSTNCRAWLYRILHNTWISQWRKTRFELPIGDLDDTLAEPSYDWEQELLSDVLPSNIQWALAQMPDTYRLAVLLADIEERTYQEIAGIMQCPIGTVMSRISRGRKMLERLLRDHDMHHGVTTTYLS
ncbi:MAG: sigma-70 family RNA polymerase sigma factor [Acidobacteriaceae bacterium]|nr:sigma-70 family RNA polymerase sigma factor [Acidobacteriaceae bacterium]